MRRCRLAVEGRSQEILIDVLLYCDKHVCLLVHLSVYISETRSRNFNIFSVHVAYMK